MKAASPDPNDIQVASWNYKSLIAKSFDGNILKIKFINPNQVMKNKKLRFQVFLDWTRNVKKWVLHACFLHARSDAQVKLRAIK